MNFARIQNEILFDDGSLRDILIRNTSGDSYESLCSLLSKSGIDFTIETDGSIMTIEDAIAEFSKGEDRHLPMIAFYIGSTPFTCHLFSKDEIELNFSPREVASLSDWDAIEGFLGKLANHFKQTVYVYPENEYTVPLYAAEATSTI